MENTQNNANITANNVAMNTEISNIMENRRNTYNEIATEIVENAAQEAEMAERNTSSNYMAAFDESYYLSNNFAPSDTADAYNASGQFNDDQAVNMFDEPKLTPSQELKMKSLELETLIVDSLARERHDHARRQFRTLEKMHQKHDDPNVRDVYYRVLNIMPKRTTKKPNYSYQNNKNKFKDVLDAISNTSNVTAFNQDNQCISSLGEMWEECDLNICSTRCKDRILKAYDMSKQEECKNLVTGMDGKRQIRMEDDIKTGILERLKYCKKIAELQKGDYESITYTDKNDLKMKIIKEIHDYVGQANLHYHSCQDLASQRMITDPKFKQIVNILETMDLTKLNIERLQDIRNDITTLPNCDKLRYDDFERGRDLTVKKGLRVGKYVIPSNTEYYKQLKSQGKDNPKVYKDLVTGKNYFYDAFSKTLTGIKYPETRNLEMKNTTTIEAPAPSQGPEAMVNNNLNNIDIETLLGLEDLKKVSEPSPSPSISTPVPVESENDSIENTMVEEVVEENVHNNHPMAMEVDEEILKQNNQRNNSLLFGLNSTNLLGYILILLVILIVLFLSVQMLKK